MVASGTWTQMSVLYEVPPTERPIPLTTAVRAISAIGVALVKNAAPTMDADSVRQAASSTLRKPHRLTMKLVAGLIPMLPTKTNRTTAPDFTGDHPNTFWNSSVSMNGTAAMAMVD